MNISSDIASLSTAMKQTQLQQNVSVSLTKKIMDTAETQAAGLLEMMPPPASGHKIDVLV